MSGLSNYDIAQLGMAIIGSGFAGCALLLAWRMRRDDRLDAERVRLEQEAAHRPAE